MNRYLKIVLLVVLAILFMFFVGCKGPAGPAGADGADGADGITGADGDDGADGADGADGGAGADGTDMLGASCMRCHTDDILYEKRFQLNQHDHATMANSLSRGGRASCGRCHSHENFVNFVTTGAGEDLDTVNGLTCRSCHTLHNSSNPDDYSFGLRVSGPVTFLTGNVENFEGDAASSTTCITCHQPRRDYTYYDKTPSDASDNVSLTSSHSGPHYGITGSLIFGIGADDRNSSIDMDQGPMQHAVAGCVTCHMGAGLKHTFKPEEENCQTCHGDIDDFDIHGVPTKMHDAIHAIELAFVTLGALEDDGEGGFDQTASSSSPTVLTGVQFSAFWNYLMLHSDHGYAYHNPPYVKAIINSIESNLGITQTAW